MSRRTRIDMNLPGGSRATAVMSLDLVGVAVHGSRACLVHRDWMTAAELREVEQSAGELATELERAS